MGRKRSKLNYLIDQSVRETNQRKVIEEFQKNPNLTVRECGLRLGVSSYFVNVALRKLGFDLKVTRVQPPKNPVRSGKHRLIRTVAVRNAMTVAVRACINAGFTDAVIADALNRSRERIGQIREKFLQNEAT